MDDLLHKGYRIQALDPIFKENDVVIRKMITGVLSGHGEDLMTIQGRDVRERLFHPQPEGMVRGIDPLSVHRRRWGEEHGDRRKPV